MCMICLEWDKGSMSSKEALGNIGETIGDPNNTEEEIEHLMELSGRIIDKELPFKEWDNDDDVGILDELDNIFGSSED